MITQNLFESKLLDKPGKSELKMDTMDIDGQTVVLRRQRSSRRSQRLRDSGCYPLEDHEYTPGVSSSGAYNGVSSTSSLNNHPTLYHGSIVSSAIKRSNRGSVCIVSLLYLILWNFPLCTIYI